MNRRRLLVLVFAQHKSTQRLLFTNRSLIIRITQEEDAYLILNRLFSLGDHFTDPMSTYRSCSITKWALGLIPIIDTLAGSR